MSPFLRQAASAALSASRTRTFTSSASRNDFVKDLYVKELRSYKAPPAAKDAHVGVVKNYSAPPTPKAPSLPGNLASELSAYEATEPSKAEDVKAATGGHSEEDAGKGAEAFLEILEKDPPKADAHH